MKILHTVEYYYPSVGGAQEVVRQISEQLVKLGHDVTVATTKLPERVNTHHNGVRIVEFDIQGNKVNGYRGKDREQYKKFLIDSRFDVVMNYAAQQWSADLFFEVMDRVKGVKIFVPCGFSGLHLPEYKEYFSLMPKVLKRYDATVYPSSDYRDINFAKKHKIKNLYVIPNGAEADEFEIPSKINLRRILNIPPDYFLVLTVGSHTGLKGHREAIEIYRRSKLRRSALLIIANDFPSGCSSWCTRQQKKWNFSLERLFRRKLLIIKELAREQTVQAYKEADLFLFPSNIEASPLVLFESAAAKTPFLVTDVGNSKEIISWTKGGKLLPTTKDRDGFSHVNIDESVSMLNDLYMKRGHLKAMAAAGYKNWKSKYNWEVIAKQYEQLYLKYVKEKQQ